MNKPIKVFVHGQRMRDIYPHATRWQVFKYKSAMLLRKVAIYTGTGLAIILIFMAGSYLNPTTVTRAIDVVKEVDPSYPVLDKIAKAESYNSQFCTKEIVAKSGCHKYEIGSVLIHVNGNGTYDIGRYAINSTHLAEALKLGYNVYEEKDNFEFAKYLFRNFGSEPWSASKLTWSK